MGFEWGEDCTLEPYGPPLLPEAHLLNLKHLIQQVLDLRGEPGNCVAVAGNLSPASLDLSIITRYRVGKEY